MLDYILDALRNTVLFLLTGVMPWLASALVMQLISNSIRKSLVNMLGVNGYVYLTAPGVMVHELGHALFCVLFNHKILGMKLFSPEKDGTLGYVNHAYDPENVYHRIGNFFIGTGPIWFGITVLWIISLLLLPSNMMQYDGSPVDGIKNFTLAFFTAEFAGRWQSYLWLYLALTITSHITLSASDFAGAVDGAVAILAAAMLAFLLFGWCGEWEAAVMEFLKNLFISVSGVLLFFTALLLIAAIIFKFISWKK